MSEGLLKLQEAHGALVQLAKQRERQSCEQCVTCKSANFISIKSFKWRGATNRRRRSNEADRTLPYLLKVQPKRTLIKPEDIELKSAANQSVVIANVLAQYKGNIPVLIIYKQIFGYVGQPLALTIANDLAAQFNAAVIVTFALRLFCPLCTRCFAKYLNKLILRIRD